MVGIKKSRVAKYALFYAVGGLCAFVAVLIAVSTSFSSTSPLTGAAVTDFASVKSLETCANVTWTETEIVAEMCSGTFQRLVCSDEPLNQSCIVKTVEDSWKCFRERSVQKSRSDCTVHGYVINNAVELNTNDYSCSFNESNGTVTGTCDSVFDGNGDGICSSGESCTRFVVDDVSVVRTEKNSGDEWVEADDSFFLQRAEVVS